MNESQPNYRNINEEDLKEILLFTEEGIVPLVRYNDDPVEMLKKACEARGARLTAIKNRVNSYLRS